MYLERILATKTKVNVLAVLIESPGRTFVEKELAGQCRASLSEVNHQIGDLVSSGLVTAQRAASDKTYQINKQLFLYKPLRSLFTDPARIYRRAAQDLATFVTPGGIAKTVSDRYLEIATELHSAGYDIESSFERTQIEDAYHFAEDLLDTVRANVSDLLG